MGIFSKIYAGLTSTRERFAQSVKAVFSGRVDEDFFEELEEALILADVGVPTSQKMIASLRTVSRQEGIKERSQLWSVLKEEIARILAQGGSSQLELDEGRLNILMVTGVNGAGKTTTIGKLASRFCTQGKTVLLAAADTYRAAAADQLAVWAERAGVGLIRQGEGADPAAVVFDAIAAAQARKIEVLIVDTAGRLHNKTNLMAELAKIGRVIEREAPQAMVSHLLVVDGSSGQNAVNQAKQFQEALPLHGVVITKLDGSAKGGAVIGIADETSLPIKLIGVGEGIDDLQQFDAVAFANALFEGQE